MELVNIGAIVKAHGIAGEVKIIGNEDIFIKKFTHEIYTENNIVLHIEKARNHKNAFVVKFREFNNINDLEPILFQQLFITKENLPKLELDKYYYNELIGKKIINQAGVIRGQVVDIRALPVGDYLVVLVNEEEKLIPFRKEFVLSVDTDIKIMEIEGLL